MHLRPDVSTERTAAAQRGQDERPSRKQNKDNDICCNEEKTAKEKNVTFII